jgi:DNA invertase Pin-like site-specific DNA recombinase
MENLSTSLLTKDAPAKHQAFRSPRNGGGSPDKKFDVLLVWKFDRLSRSMRDLINTISEIESLGPDFISHEDQIDTSPPTGKLVFHVIGSVAELECDIIRARVRHSLTPNAKASAYAGLRTRIQ